jgi:hypothetical protein
MFLSESIDHVWVSMPLDSLDSHICLMYALLKRIRETKYF